MDETSLQIEFDDNSLLSILYGNQDENLKYIEKALGISVYVKGNQIILRGAEQEVRIAERLLKELYYVLKKGYRITPHDVGFALRIIRENGDIHLKEIFLDTIFLTSKRVPVVPKSINQKRYIEAIRNYDIVIGIGPAGTGKTYLAMAMAVSALFNKEVNRIILTRPAVEAGEKLGYLPGDIQEKVNPYLRPLYDALHDMIDYDKAMRLIERGVIEVAPLAFMRGRTLNDSFIILDEAQNTTSEQMKMFLTRLGFRSKAVITGDITQIDLPQGKPSGLIESQKILASIEGIAFIYFTEKDVVRHPLVQKIIKAYEIYESQTRQI